MTVENQYSLSGSAAEMYEQYMVPAFFLPLTKILLEYAQLRVGESVLDLACGTGIVARLAWPQVAPSGRVVAIDVNAAMLKVAHAAAQREGASIEWQEANASSMPMPSGEFDVVLCQHGLQYFPDRRAALAEIHRVLRPAGRLALILWRPIQYNPTHAVLAEALERHVGAEAAATRRAPYSLTDRNEIRTLMAGAKFRDIAVHLETSVVRFPSSEAMIRMMMAGTPLAAAMAKTDVTVLQAVIDEVGRGLAAYSDDHGLAIPAQCWIVTANV